MNKIKDFGEHIGGARKELWLKNDGMSIEDIDGLTQIEKEKHIIKQNIWLKPKYEEMKDNYSIEKLAFLKHIYNNMPAKPSYSIVLYGKYDLFISFIKDIKKRTEEIISLPNEDFKEAVANKKLYKDFINHDNYEKHDSLEYYYSTYDLLTNKVLKALRISLQELEQDIYKDSSLLKPSEWFERYYKIYLIDGEKIKIVKDGDKYQLQIKKMFGTSCCNIKNSGKYLIMNSMNNSNIEVCETEDDAKNKYKEMLKNYSGKTSASNVKKQIKAVWHTPTIINDADSYRKGPECLFNKNITGQNYLDIFKFRGGEFGNWLSNKDRQNTLNAGFEAFMDLANVLGIDEKSISLDGKLAIAFGSRGHSKAAAHYEPARNVINLTKMNGAGCLAHEWGHALSQFLRDSGMSNEVQEIYKLCKFKKGIVEASTEEIEKNLQRFINNCMTWFLNDGSYYKMNEDEKSIVKDKVEKLIREAYADPNKNYFKYSNRFMSIDLSSVDKLNEYFKNNYGKVLNKSVREKVVNFERCASEYAKKAQRHETTIKTDYYQKSLKFDTQYQKNGGYWADDEEMFARAFDSYVFSKLTYLTYYLSYGGQGQPLPKDDEKKVLDVKFEELIEKACEKGLLCKGNVNFNILKGDNVENPHIVNYYQLSLEI